MFLWVRVDFSSVFCRKQAVHRRGQTSIRMTSIAVKNVLSRAALSSSRGAITRVIASSWITEFTPLAYQQQRTYFSKEESKSVYEYGAHRSDAEARIDEIPVVMVDGPVALCDGGKIEREVVVIAGGCSMYVLDKICFEYDRLLTMSLEGVGSC